MKKIIATLMLGLMVGGMSMNVQAQDEQKLEIKLTQKDMSSYFGRLLPAMAKKGNTEAIELMEQAKLNGGKLEVNFQEMQALIKKWDPKFAQNIIKIKFGQLLKAKLAEGDLEAQALKDKADANGGKLELGFAEMVKLVNQWTDTNAI